MARRGGRGILAVTSVKFLLEVFWGKKKRLFIVPLVQVNTICDLDCVQGKTKTLEITIDNKIDFESSKGHLPPLKPFEF